MNRCRIVSRLDSITIEYTYLDPTKHARDFLQNSFDFHALYMGCEQRQ
jgi:hypothetical protein